MNAYGRACLPGFLDAEDCARLIGSYADRRRYRSVVDMAQNRFGSGEYRYFAYPLPRLVSSLRRLLYGRLVPLANQWTATSGKAARYPSKLDDYLDLCHTAGQSRPTPLMLRYETGDYNCLHQDLYGDLAFPFQAVVCLSRREVDFTGGEFLLVEQRPRAQSKAEALVLNRGDAVIFANAQRPVQGRRGRYLVNLRHGLSPVRSGLRYALGIIFHDAL